MPAPKLAALKATGRTSGGGWLLAAELLEYKKCCGAPAR
jgi:hypothetical protein